MRDRQTVGSHQKAVCLTRKKKLLHVCAVIVSLLELFQLPSPLTSRCQSSPGVSTHRHTKACVCDRNVSVLINAAHSPNCNSLRLRGNISCEWALPIPALTDCPPFFFSSLRFLSFSFFFVWEQQTWNFFILFIHAPTCFPAVKHRVCVVVMIGFLLCNLLEFSLSHQQVGTVCYPFIHAQTHTQSCTVKQSSLPISKCTRHANINNWNQRLP